MTDWVGQHIDDYRLIRLLGTGSFGEVYLGEHLHDRTWAAVKMLSLKQENWKEFVKEASTTFRLRHPHIIHLLAFGMSADDIPYLVMDYAPSSPPRASSLALMLSVLRIIPMSGYFLPPTSSVWYKHGPLKREDRYRIPRQR